jgi:hypothetical protein
MILNPLITLRQKLLRQVSLLMGSQMVDLDLDPEHYEVAFDVALGRYRQRSGNSMEESFVFLDVQPDVASYTLGDEVQEVRNVYRRTMAGTSGGGSMVDPFSLAWTNSLYMMNNPGGLGGGNGTGMLATYDFAMQYQSLVGRMFGREVMYTWDASTKVINLERRFTCVEPIALHVYNMRSEDVLLGDPYALPWLREYTVATCKMMLGEARSKFSTVAGPQGGFQLNGETMKTEARAEMDRLEKELSDLMDQHIGWPLVIG